MVEFTETVRFMCRKCRGRMPTPTTNEREAFCCRGCYQQFYRKRCRVCERPIEQLANESRLLCKRSSCKSEWRLRAGFGRFLNTGSLAVETPSEMTANPGTFERVNADRGSRIDWREPTTSFQGWGRGWRIVTGPEVSRGAFFGAAVPDGLPRNGRPTWVESALVRAEAKIQAALGQHLEKIEVRREAEYVALIQARGNWNCGEPIVEAAQNKSPAIVALLASTGGLDVPAFLRRAEAQ
jgi:hypothetical protein